MSLKNSVTPPGIDPGTARIAQRLNHYATPDPPVQHVTLLNIVDNCNTMVLLYYIIILYTILHIIYNLLHYM